VGPHRDDRLPVESDRFGVNDVPRAVGLRIRVSYLAIPSYGVRGCPEQYAPVVTQLVTHTPRREGSAIS
jgi:hypothetical protein